MFLTNQNNINKETEKIFLSYGTVILSIGTAMSLGFGISSNLLSLKPIVLSFSNIYHLMTIITGPGIASVGVGFLLAFIIKFYQRKILEKSKRIRKKEEKEEGRKLRTEFFGFD
ncbi:MAG: hypothetical protein LBJ93_00640 [Clostridiales bacterium]|jgi:H+/gluconate symporter-like permease|nr:hypothetical protein [Clostridiales bacterium]